MLQRFSLSPSYLNLLGETKDINKYTILVALDVKSLYTNITNHEGIEAVKSALNYVSQKPIATKVIIKFLFLNVRSSKLKKH